MKLIISAYSKILNLYPQSYKIQFANEQLIVFQDQIQDSKQKGFWKLSRCITHEFLAILASIFSEYIHSSGEKEMLPFKRIFNINLLSFTSTFVLIAIVDFIGRYGLDYSNNIPKPINYVIWLISVGVIMAFCGWFVSASIAAKNKPWYALAFGLGYIICNLLTSTIFWEKLGLQFSSSIDTFFVNYSPLIQGIVIGLLFGWLWKGWKISVISAIAGGIIFELGYAANWLILFILYTQIHNPIPLTNLGYGRILVNWILAYLIFGLVIGCLWGIMINRINKVNQIQAI
jgi:hypothetical protein